MKGEGILIRDPESNPPDVRNFITKHGNETITSLELVRTPLSAITKFLLNVASGFTLNQKLQQANIDKLFHLSLFINNKYTLEKNEVIKFKSGNPISQQSETLNIPVDHQVSISEAIQKTQERMDGRYASYDAATNNCGDFLDNFLKANGYSDPESDAFCHQKTVELFSKFPSLTKYVTDAATTAGAVVDRQIQGEGAASYHRLNASGGLFGAGGGLDFEVPERKRDEHGHVVKNDVPETPAATTTVVNLLKSRIAELESLPKTSENTARIRGLTENLHKKQLDRRNLLKKVAYDRTVDKVTAKTIPDVHPLIHRYLGRGLSSIPGVGGTLSHISG